MGKIIISIFLIIFSIGSWSADDSVYAKLVQNNPIEHSFDINKTTELVVKITPLPPKGVSKEEYKKQLLKRSLSNVVKGVSDIQTYGVIETATDAPIGPCTNTKNISNTSSGIGPDHTAYLGSQAVGPFNVFFLDIPLNTKSAPKRSLSLLLNAGNTMVNPSTLKDSNGNTQSYHYDAVDEKNSIKYTQPLDLKNELTLRLSFFSATGKGMINPARWLVGDGFIEGFHSTVLGANDPADRKKLGFNKTIVQAQDVDGNKLHIKPGSIYVMPLELGVNHYETLFQNSKTNIGANANLTVQVPLDNNDFNKQLALGGSIGFNATRSIGNRFSITGAAKVGVSKTDFVTIGDHYKYTDKSFRGDAQGLIGINYKGGNHTTSVFTSYKRTTSAYSDLENPALKNSGRRVNRRSYFAARFPQEHIEIGASTSFKTDHKKVVTVEVTVREDTLIPHGPKDHMFVGSNNEDFGVFVGVGYKF